MKLNFQKIHIEGFLSFGEADIELSNRGYTLVNGINNNPNDNSISNGSGKSSIWEAISWNLTGETIRGIKSSINNIHTDEGVAVELDFTVDNIPYKVCRYKDHYKYKTDLKIFINGQDKSGKGIRDSEKLLEEYLPDLTSKLLGSVIILGQGLPNRFSNNTPSGRKEVLENLSKSDYMIEDIKNKLSERKSYLEIELRKTEDNDLQFITKKESLESQLKDFENKLNNLPSISSIEENIAKVSAQLSTLVEKENESKKIVDELSNKQSELNRSLQLISADENEEKSTLNEEYYKKERELSNKESEIYAKLSTLNAELRRIDNIMDVCPTCGRPMEGVVKPDTTELKANIAKFTKQRESLKEEIRVNNSNKNIELSKVSSKYNENRLSIQNNLIACENSLRNEKYNYSEIQDSRNSCQNSLYALNFEKDNYNKNKLEYENSINSIKEKIAEIESNILYNNNDKVNIQNRLDVVNKMFTIAKRDFRGFLLTNVIDFINKKSKEYSHDIFETDKIDFKLDGNNISISYDDKQYENLSGGEKQKVDIIVQFAIRDMLCQFSNFSSNIIVLDEIFDNLDSTGCDKVLNLISKKLNDIESIFIVTHHSDISIPADSVITVVKNEQGISSIK